MNFAKSFFYFSTNVNTDLRIAIERLLQVQSTRIDLFGLSIVVERE